MMYGVQVMDIPGNILIEKQLGRPLAILDLSELSTGRYLVRISQEVRSFSKQVDHNCNIRNPLSCLALKSPLHCPSPQRWGPDF